MKGWSIILSRVQCDFLVDHVDEGRPVIHDRNEDTTRAALIARELIRYDQNESLVGRPKRTMLTDRGRECVCVILGEYADALFKTGYINARPVINLPPKKKRKLAYDAPLLKVEAEKATEGELDHA